MNIFITFYSVTLTYKRRRDGGILVRYSSQSWVLFLGSHRPSPPRQPRSSLQFKGHTAHSRYWHLSRSGRPSTHSPLVLGPEPSSQLSPAAQEESLDPGSALPVASRPSSAAQLSQPGTGSQALGSRAPGSLLSSQQSSFTGITYDLAKIQGRGRYSQAHLASGQTGQPSCQLGASAGPCRPGS